MLPVVARPEVADDLARLTPPLLRALRQIVGKLRGDPMRYSQPLDYDRRIGNLGDCRNVYFDETDRIRPAGYRIVFRLLPDEQDPDRQCRPAHESRCLPRGSRASRASLTAVAT